MTLDHTAIRARVQQRMAALALSQRALARAAGIDQAALSRGLVGKTTFAVDTLAALAPALETDLASLLGLPEGGAAAEGAGELRLPLDAIAPDLRQPRRTFAAGDIEDLARSIAVHGLLQPLLVAPIAPEDRRQGPETPPPTHLLIAGERRWRALRLGARRNDLWPRGLAGVPGLEDGRAPCRLLPLAATRSPADQLAAQIVENLHRADLSPAELARGYQRLRDAGWDTRGVASSVGRSMRHVQDYLALVDRLSPPVLEALDDGALRYAQARVLTQAGQQTQHALLGRILRGDLTTERQIHDAVQASGRKAREADPDEIRLAQLPRPATAGDAAGSEPAAVGEDRDGTECGESDRDTETLFTLATWPPATLPDPVPPNAHGTFHPQFTLRLWADPRPWKARLDIRFAHTAAGWRIGYDYQHANGGGGTYPGLTDPAHATLQEATDAGIDHAIAWVDREARRRHVSQTTVARELRSMWRILGPRAGGTELAFPTSAVTAETLATPAPPPASPFDDDPVAAVDKDFPWPAPFDLAAALDSIEAHARFNVERETLLGIELLATEALQLVAAVRPLLARREPTA